MEVFSTLALFAAKQFMHHFHFAEVAVKDSTNDSWVSNYAFISRPNTLKFFIKKEKRKPEIFAANILFPIRNLRYFRLIIIFNVTEWALFSLLLYLSLSFTFFSIY